MYPNKQTSKAAFIKAYREDFEVLQEQSCTF